MVKLKIELPDQFYEAEERNGYMISSEMKQVWAVELDLLAEFMRVCEKHNIQWFADGGTMLGAIRHKGFIPWDDDIDISMPRKEYDRFCLIAEKEFKDPYFFQTYNTDSSYHLLQAKLRNINTTGILREEWSKESFNQGIFIDIFPYDNIPDGEEEMDKFRKQLVSSYAKIQFHKMFHENYRMTNDPRRRKRIRHAIKHMLTILLFDGPERIMTLIKRYESISIKYSNINTTRFADLTMPIFTTSRLNYYKKEWYNDIVLVPFESLMIPVPSQYDDYLTTLYGDWHKFVRNGSLHGPMLFDVNKPYTAYVCPKDDFLKD